MKKWLSRVFVSSMAMMLVFSSVPILDAQAVDTADHATVTAEISEKLEKKAVRLWRNERIQKLYMITKMAPLQSKFTQNRLM